MSDTTDWAAIAQKLHQDCRALESKLAEVTKQRDELQDWVDSQKSVDSTWNPQAVADLLGIRLGQRIRENIQPKIEELIQKIAEVTKQRDELGDALQRFVNRLQYSSVFMDGKMTCARVNRNPIKEWDEDCIFAFEVLEKLKGGEG